MNCIKCEKNVPDFDSQHCTDCVFDPSYTRTECGRVVEKTENKIIEDREYVYCDGCMCSAQSQTSNGKIVPRGKVYELNEPHFRDVKLYNYEDRNRRLYVKNYQYIPDRWFGRPGRLYGFELELQYRGFNGFDLVTDLSPGEYMRRFGRMVVLASKGEIIAKHDSSISGNGGSPGFELVSAPLTDKKFEDHIPFMDRLISSLSDNGFRTSTMCGLHIHVTNDISKVRLLRIVNFFIQNPNLVLCLSGKDYRRMEEYSSIKEMARDPVKSVYNSGFYSRKTAINITDNTIEFRPFCSTLKPYLVLAFYQFVRSMMELSSHKITEEILREHAQKYYPELKNRLSRITIKKYYNEESEKDKNMRKSYAAGISPYSDTISVKQSKVVERDAYKEFRKRREKYHGVTSTVYVRSENNPQL